MLGESGDFIAKCGRTGIQWRLLVLAGARVRPQIAFVHSSDGPESCRLPTPTGSLPRPVPRRIVNRTSGDRNYTTFWSNPVQKESDARLQQ